jgi:hypothetical protein
MAFEYSQAQISDTINRTNMAVEFEPFEVAGARVYYGNTLPYGLRVGFESTDESKTPSVADSAASLGSWAKSGKIGNLLDRHGAVLIRGVGHLPRKRSQSW